MLAFDSLLVVARLKVDSSVAFSSLAFHVCFFIRLVFQVCFFVSLLTLVGSVCLSTCVLSGVAFGCDRSKIFFLQQHAWMSVHVCFSFVSVCLDDQALNFLLLLGLRSVSGALLLVHLLRPYLIICFYNHCCSGFSIDYIIDLGATNFMQSYGTCS